MEELKERAEFDLSSPLKVAINIDGENTFAELGKLYLKAPTYRHKDYTLFLKKKFLEALFNMTNKVDRDDAQGQIDKASSNDEDKLDSQAIKAILFASEGFDIVTFYKKFVKFFTIDVCFKDEDLKQPVLANELEKLNENDLEDLIAKYIEVFFIASWMKTLK